MATGGTYEQRLLEFCRRRARSKKKKTVESSKPEGFAERCAAFAPDGKYGKWIRTLPAIARVNDSIFLHGGIVPDLVSYSVDKLNEAIAAEMKAFDTYKEFMVDKKIVPTLRLAR